MGTLEGTQLDSAVRGALATVEDPDLGKDLVSLGMIKKVEIDAGSVTIGVELTTPACPMKDKIQADIEAAVGPLVGARSIGVEWSARAARPRTGSMENLSRVGRIVLVASGKGGVGKSTVAANLASALLRRGARVGLLDADIYGPSLPTMFQLEDTQIYSADQKNMLPLESQGLKLMSIGWLVPADQAMIWRGPMLGSAVSQLFGQTAWGELDYLIVDLPPGTGDVQLTIAQQLQVSGAFLVTTPQELSVVDVARAHAMFEKVRVPVLGVIENMSWFTCDGCDKRHAVFGEGGGERAASSMGVPLVGSLPIETVLRDAADSGLPAVLRDPDSAGAAAFLELAGAVASRIEVEEQAAASRASHELKAAAKGKRSLPIIG